MTFLNDDSMLIWWESNTLCRSIKISATLYWGDTILAPFSKRALDPATHSDLASIFVTSLKLSGSLHPNLIYSIYCQTCLIWPPLWLRKMLGLDRWSEQTGEVYGEVQQTWIFSWTGQEVWIDRCRITKSIVYTVTWNNPEEQLVLSVYVHCSSSFVDAAILRLS